MLSRFMQLSCALALGLFLPLTANAQNSFRVDDCWPLKAKNKKITYKAKEVHLFSYRVGSFQPSFLGHGLDDMGMAGAGGYGGGIGAVPGMGGLGAGMGGGYPGAAGDVGGNGYSVGGGGAPGMGGMGGIGRDDYTMDDGYYVDIYALELTQKQGGRSKIEVLVMPPMEYSDLGGMGDMIGGYGGMGGYGSRFYDDANYGADELGDDYGGGLGGDGGYGTVDEAGGYGDGGDGGSEKRKRNGRRALRGDGFSAGGLGGMDDMAMDDMGDMLDDGMGMGMGGIEIYVKLEQFGPKNAKKLPSGYAMSVEEIQAISDFVKLKVWRESLTASIQKNAKDSAFVEESTPELKKLLSEQYSNKLALQQLEIKAIEAKVVKLRAQLARRRAAMQQVVEVQTGRIILEAQGLLRTR
ncbi:MAG: hypothetical protein AAF483_05020 [Planctomycetota bacterium]